MIMHSDSLLLVLVDGWYEEEKSKSFIPPPLSSSLCEGILASSAANADGGSRRCQQAPTPTYVSSDDELSSRRFEAAGDRDIAMPGEDMLNLRVWAATRC